MHIILYLYAQISSLSLPGVSFLEKGRTLHKGNQKQVLGVHFTFFFFFYYAVIAVSLQSVQD